MAVQIQVRRGTASDWAAANPVLLQGEPGLETDTGRLKYGDGTTAWNSLGYFMDDTPNIYLQSSQPSMVTGDLWVDLSSTI